MCVCIERVNGELEPHGHKLHLPIIGPQRPMIEIVRLDGKKSRKTPLFFCSNCPFCGEDLGDVVSESDRQEKGN